jgi:hypothetical protein
METSQQTAVQPELYLSLHQQQKSSCYQAELLHGDSDHTLPATTDDTGGQVSRFCDRFTLLSHMQITRITTGIESGCLVPQSFQKNAPFFFSGCYFDVIDFTKHLNFDTFSTVL